MQLPAAGSPDSGLTSPLDLLRLLVHHKWKIAGLALIGGLIAALYAYTKPPLYQATATVLIESRESKAVQVQEVYDPGLATDNYLTTQLEVIRSRGLVEKVVQRLHLTDETEFTSAQSTEPGAFWANLFADINWQRWLPFVPTTPKAADVAAEPDAQKKLDIVIARVSQRITTAPVPRTQLIRVNLVAHSPQLAADCANALADAYIEYGLEARLETSRKATRWLTDKLADIRGSLENSEKSLQGFREKQQIVSVGGTRGLLGEELLDNSKRLREAQKARTQLSNTYSKIVQAGSDVRKLEQIGDLVALPLVQAAKSNLVQALENLKQLQQRYGEKHPSLATALTRVETAERSFRDQILLAAQSIRTEYEISRDNERTLSDAVETEKNQLRLLDRKEYEQSVLEREVSSNKQLYDLFLNSFKEADSSSSYEPIKVRILETAKPPALPFEPQVRRVAIKGLIIGFLLGIVLVLARHALDETVRSPEELEALTGLPVISVIPAVPSGIGPRQSLAAAFAENPRSPFAESIRSARAGLKLNDVDRTYKRILVTSAIPGEGKSTVASCLAMAFCADEKVLLIEGDLRAPTFKKMFGLPKNVPGLMEALSGASPLQDCIYLHKPSGLHILPVATTPSNPAEIITSASFAKLVADLSERFDRILLDSPPCQAASDALVLAKMADVVLFTIRADATRRRAVSAAIKQLRQVQAHVVGSVLNQVNPRKNPGYADAYYYRRQYYG